MEFIYPAPLSSLEFIRGLRDIRTAIASLEHFSGEGEIIRREITAHQNIEGVHDYIRERTLSRGATPRRTVSMPVFILDLVFVAIGAAAFAGTALYLSACANL